MSYVWWPAAMTPSANSEVYGTCHSRVIGHLIVQQCVEGERSTTHFGSVICVWSWQCRRTTYGISCCMNFTKDIQSAQRHETSMPNMVSVPWMCESFKGGSRGFGLGTPVSPISHEKLDNDALQAAVEPNPM